MKSFKNKVTTLLQAYVSLENAAKQNDTNRVNQISAKLDKIYESIFDDFFEINEADRWLYDDLKHANKERYGMNQVFEYLTDKLMNEMDEENRFNLEGTKELLFNKENGIWYIDLPLYIELGHGNKNNLMMVDGADTFLDMLSNNGTSVKVKVSINVFDGFEAMLIMINKGKNQQLLEQIGHASVDYGAYYKVEKYKGADSNHILWLCPVTEYVFGGSYPDKIWLKIIN